MMTDAMPMMMTAAGTVKAARVVILGVGVAGLQAIATAKRLGAVIEASDVRPSVKEQVESLGAKFIDVSYDTDEEKEAAQGSGGYAKPMPQSWLDRQKAEVAKRVAQAVVPVAEVKNTIIPIRIVCINQILILIIVSFANKLNVVVFTWRCI